MRARQKRTSCQSVVSPGTTMDREGANGVGRGGSAAVVRVLGEACAVS